MSFIEQSEQNVDRLMKEVTGGSVGGFVGRAGKEIDDMFAGTYHPDYGEIENILKKQIKDRKEKRTNLDKIEYGGESPLGGYNDIETDAAIETYDILYAEDEAKLKFNKEVTPVLDTEFRITDKGLEMYDTFDEPGEAYGDRWKSNSWDYDYDEKPTYAGDNFINRSTTNWKYINEGDK